MKYLQLLSKFIIQVPSQILTANYNAFQFFAVSVIFFITSACNREAREYNASLNFHSQIDTDYSIIILRDDLPSQCDLTLQNGSAYTSYFFYDSTKSWLEKINNNDLISTFLYYPDSIKLKVENLAKDSLVAILQNKRVQFLLNQNTRFRYDSNGYLIDRVNSYDSTHFTYSNGNLIKKVQWLSFMNMTYFTDYYYYDSIFIHGNASFFLLESYLPETGGTSDGELRYLDIFGHCSKNLPRLIRVSRGNIPDTTDFSYKWDIKNERIEKMEIYNDTLRVKTRKYYY
jgi:hypothetical protein